jgi:hypothetical protein
MMITVLTSIEKRGKNPKNGQVERVADGRSE